MDKTRGSREQGAHEPKVCQLSDLYTAVPVNQGEVGKRRQQVQGGDRILFQSWK